ncbi:hypothetical protein BJ508DRAFT_309569 [Ascobolus immersus RN42]|uniref:Uncharacterized protein n=1 Tax=Ascobolus immersus RN42 TaxID=1160509 RepID=A0A3N4I8G9_ASCIM|nr:hypothetical protein BJ508DRAFT_309569 [Ascobolus immersus RN42]
MRFSTVPLFLVLTAAIPTLAFPTHSSTSPEDKVAVALINYFLSASPSYGLRQRSELDFEDEDKSAFIPAILGGLLPIVTMLPGGEMKTYTKEELERQRATGRYGIPNGAANRAI